MKLSNRRAYTFLLLVFLAGCDRSDRSVENGPLPPGESDQQVEPTVSDSTPRAPTQLETEGWLAAVLVRFGHVMWPPEDGVETLLDPVVAEECFLKWDLQRSPIGSDEITVTKFEVPLASLSVEGLAARVQTQDPASPWMIRLMAEPDSGMAFSRTPESGVTENVDAIVFRVDNRDVAGRIVEALGFIANLCAGRMEASE